MSDRIRVLHVDDEPDFGQVVAEFLERENDRFSVETVASAREGLFQLEGGSYDCIVSDYDMPEQDGIEFLEAVRDQHPRMPFVLFTGKGSEEIASEAISAGVTDYLQKAVGSDQYAVLANRIENAVEKYRAEQEASQSRSRLEAITENSTDAILTIDTENRIRFANPAVEQLFGYAPDELVGAPLIQLIPSRFREDHREAIERYLDTGERSIDWRAVEFPALHRNGHEFPVSISFSEFDELGDRRFVGVIRDISDRVQMEEELRERELRFRQVAENIQEVVWMSDQNKDEMLYVNPAYEEIWGASVESLYEDPESFLEPIHPDDQTRVEKAIAAQASGGYDEEYRIVRPDGEIRWIHDRAVPVDNNDGEVYRIVGIASDITDRVESRRQLETLIRNVPGMVYRVRNESSWPMEFMRGQCEALTGYSAEELVEGDVEYGEDVIHAADQSMVWEEVQTAITRNEPFEITYRIVTKQGRTKWVWERGRRVEGEEAEVAILEGFITDVTERKERERKLERQNERLDEFASVVSHDLQNPLTLAAGRLELAQQECESPHLKEVAQAHEQMNALIDDLLELARQGGEIQEVERVQLADFVAACWANIETGQAVLNNELDIEIEANRSRLKQLLENVFQNAVEHGGEGVTVTVGEMPGGFYVADDGPGIPLDVREKVFEAGYSTRNDGTGFGLRIVKQVVDAHDWTVTITDGPAGGARFEFTGVTILE